MTKLYDSNLDNSNPFIFVIQESFTPLFDYSDYYLPHKIIDSDNFNLHFSATDSLDFYYYYLRSFFYIINDELFL